MDLYFSDHFKVKPEDLEKYGAFNISLVFDLPLFIDPFLLFNSKKKKYQNLHKSIINYLLFLKRNADEGQSPGALKAWYMFKEVEQTWLGFSATGNKGSALGMDFAKALNENLYGFQAFGKEKITKGSHLERLCLIKDGVGKDNISDFATNLIKEFLLSYTQTFAQKHIDKNLRDTFRVERVHFNYKTESWEEKTFDLPKFKDDFVILTPKDLLTKDDTWINKRDLFERFEQIPNAIPNVQLRFQVNNYLQKKLNDYPKRKKGPTKKEKKEVALATINAFPELIDYYIKYKEDRGDHAETISNEKVSSSEAFFIKNVQDLILGLEKIGFYSSTQNSYEEAKKKIYILKNYIENNDGYKLFYHKADCVGTEKNLHLIFGLICHDSIFDINREVNNGRGSVDYKFSRGSKDKTLVEFKLAKNTKLEQNLKKQVEIYEKANQTNSSFKVIIYFTEDEYKRAERILNDLDLLDKDNIVLIDARSDNKVSASNA